MDRTKQITAAALIFALFAQPLKEAAAAGTGVFNRQKHPVGNVDFILLIERGYRFADDGTLQDPRTKKILTQEDYSYLIEDLRSRSRLKALMEINLILSRNDYSSALPAADLEKIREIGRRHWSLLSKSVQDQITPYFKPPEIFELNRTLPQAPDISHPNDGRTVQHALLPNGVPLPIDAPLNTMAGPLMPISNTEQASYIRSAPARPPQPKSDLPPARKSAPLPLPTETQLENKIPPPPAPLSPAPVPEAEQEAPPAFKATAPAPLRPAPVPEPEQEAPPAFKATIPAPPPVATAAASSDLAQTILNEPESAPNKPALAVRYPEYKPELFSLFLKTSPYSEDVRNAIRRIESAARPQDRDQALGTLMLALPQINLASPETAGGIRYSLGDTEDSAKRPRIEVRGRLAYSETKKLMSGVQMFLYPAGAQQISSSQEGSRTLSLSSEQKTGTVLHALMILDEIRMGRSARDARSELKATLAEFNFYKNLPSGKDPVLDPDRAALYSEWKNRPLDFHDFFRQIPDGRNGVQPPADKTPKQFEYFEPGIKAFSAEVPTGWEVVEAQTPNSVSVHLLGPSEAEGAWRTAYHIHIIDKNAEEFQDVRSFLKALHEKDDLSQREPTQMRSIRVSRKASRTFETREARFLPYGLLPAATVKLHHYTAVVPHGKDEYALIKLSTTEESYLKYRGEFHRFLKSFRITGL